YAIPTTWTYPLSLHDALPILCRYTLPAIAATVMAVSLSNATAQDREVIPHAQDKPPGPALSPQEAIAKMQVPEGFSVELVASEPDRKSTRLNSSHVKISYAVF